MFRRFGIIRDDGTKSERLINLKAIALIGVDSRGRTFIRVCPGPDAPYCDYRSEVEYEHLAAAMDGVSF